MSSAVKDSEEGRDGREMIGEILQYCTARQQVQIEVRRRRQQRLHSASKRKGDFSLVSIFFPVFINTDMTAHAALVARSCVTLSVVITGFLDD